MRILLFLLLPALTATSALAGDDQAPFVEHVARNGSLYGNAVLGLGDVDGDGVDDWSCAGPTRSRRGRWAAPSGTSTSRRSPAGGAVLPGDTWRFQVWYRDANPTPTSNFTDASSILFQ